MINAIGPLTDRCVPGYVRNEKDIGIESERHDAINAIYLMTTAYILKETDTNKF